MREATINGIEYKFNAIWGGLKKTPKSSGNISIELQLQIWRDGEQIEWKDIKNTYAAEVIARYVMNTINEV